MREKGSEARDLAAAAQIPQGAKALLDEVAIERGKLMVCVRSKHG